MIVENPGQRLVVDRFQQTAIEPPSRRPAGRLFRSALREIKFGAQQVAVRATEGAAYLAIATSAVVAEISDLHVCIVEPQGSATQIAGRTLFGLLGTAIIAVGSVAVGDGISKIAENAVKTIGERRDTARRTNLPLP